MSRRKAKKFIEAAAAPASPAEAPREMAGLLGAVELLKESAPAPTAPDPGFAAALKTNLMARYDELVAGEEAPAKPSAPAGNLSRWMLWGIPALAAAAALIVTLVLVVSTSVDHQTVASLKVYAGKAVIVEPDGSSHTVTGSRDVHEQDTVKVDGGSRAALNFKNKNVARLEAGTEVKVAGYSGQTVALLEKTGKVYNRVVKGTNYSVQHGEVEVRAVGTAFDVEAAGKGLNAPVFEGTVEVFWPGSGQPFRVEQGSQATVTFNNGGYDIKVASFDLSKLDFSWLAFNRDLDKKAHFPLGVLEKLEVTPPQGTQPPGTVPGNPAPATPGGPAPASVPSTPGQPVPTTPQADISVSLTVTDKGPPVLLSWTATNSSAAQTVNVVRSTGSGIPAYPGNAVARLSSSATSYSDADVQAGATYTYAVVYASGGNAMGVSNTVSVTVPQPSPTSLNVSLSGFPITGGFQLKWSADGVADSWVVLRSQGGSSFSPYAAVSGGGSGGSYTDPKVDPKATYSWRVQAMVGGRVAGTSNTFSN